METVTAKIPLEPVQLAYTDKQFADLSLGTPFRSNSALYGNAIEYYVKVSHEASRARNSANNGTVIVEHNPTDAVRMVTNRPHEWDVVSKCWFDMLEVGADFYHGNTILRVKAAHDAYETANPGFAGSPTAHINPKETRIEIPVEVVHFRDLVRDDVFAVFFDDRYYKVTGTDGKGLCSYIQHGRYSDGHPNGGNKFAPGDGGLRPARLVLRVLRKQKERTAPTTKTAVPAAEQSVPYSQIPVGDLFKFFSADAEPMIKVANGYRHASEPSMGMPFSHLSPNAGVIWVKVTRVETTYGKLSAGDQFEYSDLAGVRVKQADGSYLNPSKAKWQLGNGIRVTWLKPEETAEPKTTVSYSLISVGQCFRTLPRTDHDPLYVRKADGISVRDADGTVRAHLYAHLKPDADVIPVLIDNLTSMPEPETKPIMETIEIPYAQVVVGEEFISPKNNNTYIKEAGGCRLVTDADKHAQLLFPHLEQSRLFKVTRLKPPAATMTPNVEMLAALSEIRQLTENATHEQKILSEFAKTATEAMTIAQKLADAQTAKEAADVWRILCDEKGKKFEIYDPSGQLKSVSTTVPLLMTQLVRSMQREQELREALAKIIASPLISVYEIAAAALYQDGFRPEHKIDLR